MALSDLLDTLNRALSGTKGPSPFPAPLTRAPGIQFATTGVQPPAVAYVSLGAVLTFTAQSAVTTDVITCSYRVLLPSGEVKGFTRSFAATGLYTRDSITETMPECILLNVQMGATNATGRGTTFGRVTLTGGFTTNRAVVWEITRGYISQNQSITYPPGQFDSPQSGVGFRLLYLGTNPAAGVEVSEPLPLVGRGRLVTLRVRLVTDATVADRQVRLLISRSGVGSRFLPAATSQEQSTSRLYEFVPYTNTAILVGDQLITPLDDDIIVDNTFTVATSTTNFQAGDNWNVPAVEYEVWPLE